MQTRVRPASFWLSVIGPLVVALAVRVIALGERSLWLDEAWSVQCSLAPTLAELFERLNIGTGPVYPLALRGWAFVFGQSEFALRSLSVLAGGLAAMGAAVWMRNLLLHLRKDLKEGGELWIVDSAAAVAGLVVAFHPILVGLSREVRPYAFSHAFGFWACALSVPAYLAKTSPMRFARFLVPILAALSISDHLFTAFLLMGMVLSTVAGARSMKVESRSIAVGAVATLALLALQLPLTLHQARLHYSTAGAELPLGLRDYGHLGIQLLGGWPAAIAMVLVVIGIGFATLRDPTEKYAIGVLIMSCLPFIGIHFLGTPLLKGGARYVAWTIGPIALAVAGLIAASGPRWRGWIGVSAVLLGLGAGTVAFHRFELSNAEDWRGVAARINGEGGGSGVVLCSTGGIEIPLSRYYKGPFPLLVLREGVPGHPDDPAIRQALDVSKTSGVIWLVWSHAGTLDPEMLGAIERTLGPSKEVMSQRAIRVFRFAH